MRGVRGWQRVVAVATLSASLGLLVQAGPVQAAAPGTLIAAAPQPDGWHGTTGGSVIEYWMTGSDGTPRPASGALYLPPGPPPPGGWPIMAYDHGTSGLGPGCGGQADPQRHPYQYILRSEEELIQRMVAKGFAVVAPDYLGLGRYATGPHPYLEVRTEATATIDLVRAARAAAPELSRSWGVVGASQGGQAALGTGHLQATYAPDLDFRGTVAIDPASDVEKALPLAGPGIPPVPKTDGAMGFFVSILAGLRAARPDVDVDGYLTPQGKAVLDEIGDTCLDGVLGRVAGLGVGDILARPLSDDRIRAAYTDYLTVPASGYDRPILLLLNATDTTVPSPLHAALVAQFAANGVDFRTVAGTGKHTELNGQMWAALDAFLEGVSATPTLR